METVFRKQVCAMGRLWWTVKSVAAKEKQKLHVTVNALTGLVVVILLMKIHVMVFAVAMVSFAQVQAAVSLQQKSVMGKTMIAIPRSMKAAFAVHLQQKSVTTVSTTIATD
jgi:hypothetical protein